MSTQLIENANSYSAQDKQKDCEKCLYAELSRQHVGSVYASMLTVSRTVQCKVQMDLCEVTTLKIQKYHQFHKLSISVSAIKPHAFY